MTNDVTQKERSQMASPALSALLCLSSCAFWALPLTAQRGGGPPASGGTRASCHRQCRSDRRRRKALQRNVHGLSWERRHRRRARTTGRLTEPPLPSENRQRDFRHGQEWHYRHADAAVFGAVQRRSDLAGHGVYPRPARDRHRHAGGGQRRERRSRFSGAKARAAPAT